MRLAAAFALLFVALCATAHGWGSSSPTASWRPWASWQKHFPATPTVIVVAGQSVATAQTTCDNLLGASGWCHIQLRGVPSDTPIDIFRSRTKLSSNGVELTFGAGSNTCVAIYTTGIRYVAIEDLNIRGHSADSMFAIEVWGSDIGYLIIRNNNIYNLDAVVDAHGIAVYGAGPRAIRHVLIDGNELYNLKTGSSESLVINGNVYRWTISNNYVHDVNNIAIDVIGGENTDPASAGARVPRGRDAARWGVIEFNTVERMSLVGNAQYEDEFGWAAGIYVDGARYVFISGNTVRGVPWGIEVGAENCVTASHVMVKDNEVSGSYYGDFLIGGYNPRGYLADRTIKCLRSEDIEEGHGYVKYVTVTDNSFTSNSGRASTILAQFRTTYTIIAEPGAVAENDGGNGSAPGDENAIRTTL